jgi:hypothetical protein
VDRGRNQPRDRRAKERRQKLLGVGQHQADQIAPSQPGGAQRGGDAQRRRLKLRVRAQPIAVVGDETIARVGARGVRQRPRQRP